MQLLTWAIRHRWIMLAFIGIVSISCAWAHGFLKGRQFANVKTIEKVVEKDAESRRSAEKVKKSVNRIADDLLDSALCDLAILRENNHCQ